MKSISILLQNLHEDEAGLSTVEYIILLILIACTVIAIVSTFGTTIQAKFTEANTEVESQVVAN